LIPFIYKALQKKNQFKEKIKPIYCNLCAAFFLFAILHIQYFDLKEPFKQKELVKEKINSN
jgi:hypothetical protein